jgi:hypothetical protein
MSANEESDMKRWIVFSLGLLLAMSLSLEAGAQEPQEKKEGAKKVELGRLSGRIQMINKATSTITLVRGNVRRTVIYSPETRITLLNKPSTMDEVKEGRRVIVLGQLDAKGHMNAARIDVRE